MFDFRKLHSLDILLIDIPFHDEFGDNNDTLVTSAGVQILGLNPSSTSRQLVQKSPVSAPGMTTAQRIMQGHPALNEGFAKPRRRRRHTTRAMR